MFSNSNWMLSRVSDISVGMLMVKYNFKQFYYFNINVYLLDLKFWSQKAWKEVLRHPAMSCLSYHALPGAEMTSPKKMLSKKCPSSKWLFLRGGK